MFNIKAFRLAWNAMQVHNKYRQIKTDFSDAARENEVIVCVGKGLRSISEELQVVDALLSPKDDSATPRMEKSSYYLTLWDADVPKQALALSAVLKSRKSMETHS